MSAAGRPFWLLYTSAFFLARLPFIFGGYGADTDAYRVALSAKYLWATGEYVPSRLPGYPLHELVVALLIWGGPALTNVATVCAAFGGVLIFDRIVVRLRLPGRPWLLLAIGFTPWLLVTSTATLDYHFALTAMLGAYALLLASAARRETRNPRFDGTLESGGRWDSGPLLAGILLGIAVGFRITAGAFLLPLLVLVVRDPRFGSPAARSRAAAILVGSTAAVSLLVMTPVLWTYGARFWNFADSRVSPDVVIQTVGQWALGALGALVTLGVLAANGWRLARLPALLRTDAQVLSWVVTILIYTLLYLRLPVDLGYLVPVYPFAFLLVARVLARWALPVIFAAALVSGVVDLNIQGLHNFSPVIAAREVRPSWRVAGFAHDWRTRTRWRDFARRILDQPLPPKSVVLTGGAFPDVAVAGWDRFRYAIIARDLSAVSMISDNGALWDDARETVYLAVSEPRILDSFRTQGYSVLRAVPEGEGWRVRLIPVP